MKQNISDSVLREILGTELTDNAIIDDKIEEAYTLIREKAKKKGQGNNTGNGQREKQEAEKSRKADQGNRKQRNTGTKSAERKKSDKKRTGKQGRLRGKRIAIGFGSAAAVVVCMFAFCVMNPVMAREIPFLGSLFEKVADVFPFGRLPEEDTTVLYAESGTNGTSTETEGKNNTGQNAEDAGEQTGSGEDALYRKTDGDITITLTEEYASNQAVFIGVRIENRQEFPEMVSYADGSGTQLMQVWTKERYSFRPDPIQDVRDIKGKFEDAHTFLGIMRIDYSEIDVDDSLYLEACDEAVEKGEELPAVDSGNWDQYFSRYEVPSSFDMELEFTRLKGDLADNLADPVRPDYLKSDEEILQMTDEEWKAYTNAFPKDWMEDQWRVEGSWAYRLSIAQKDEEARVVTIKETNEDGVGFESLEISSVEMTLNTIEPGDASTIAVALDADGRQLESGGDNFYELSIAGHDISTVYLYLCDYDEYMDELKGYRLPESPNHDNYQSILEERALFKLEVKTTE